MTSGMNLTISQTAAQASAVAAQAAAGAPRTADPPVTSPSTAHQLTT